MGRVVGGSRLSLRFPNSLASNFGVTAMTEGEGSRKKRVQSVSLLLCERSVASARVVAGMMASVAKGHHVEGYL